MRNTLPSSLEALLVRYAAGKLSTQESLVVATFLSMNPHARKQVAVYETYAGQMIEEEEQADLCTSCLDSVWQRIDSGTASQQEKPIQHFPDIPHVLAAMLSECMEIQNAHWQSLRGFERMDLHLSVPCTSQYEIFLMRLAPEQKTPVHRHHGIEITLVLEGDYMDCFGHHKKGDIVIVTDDRIPHSPAAGHDGCVCLVVAEGNLRFENPISQMIRQFFG